MPSGGQAQRKGGDIALRCHRRRAQPQATERMIRIARLRPRGRAI